MTVKNSQKRDELKIEELPLPLALAIKEYQNETQPFRKVHRLIDAVEVLIKLHTVMVVSKKFDAEKIDNELKALLYHGFRTPSLGIWWAFAREFAKVMTEDEITFSPEMIKNIKKKGKLFKSLETDDNLIAFRNKYAHGATPSDKECEKDISKYGKRFEELVVNAGYLNDLKLISVLNDGRIILAKGLNVKEIEPVEYLVKVGNYILCKDDSFISLDPLLVYRESSGLYFFYNDLRKSDLSILNYEMCLHERDRELRDYFLDKYPIYERVDYASEKFKDMIELLTETFKGRQNELQKLIDFFSNRQRGFLFIWGGPGVGKSALLARVAQMLGWSEEVRKQAGIKEGIAAEKLYVFEYFIRRDMGTNNTEEFLDNMILRLESRFRTGVKTGRTVKEKVEAYQNQLKIISAKLKEDQRLVLIIDGLDEGVEVSQLLESLPRWVPDKVLVLYASRENPDVVNKVFDNLMREFHDKMTLTGLSLEDTRALLTDYVNKYELNKEYVEAVAEKSQGNPLYIKLLCQELEFNNYKLNDTVNLPEKMSDIYDKIMKRLSEVQFANDFLRLLAVSKDYLTAEMAASIMGVNIDEMKNSIIRSCMEVLIENPLTEDYLDYQLFHESLREYIISNKDFAESLYNWKLKLVEWCSDWKNKQGPALLYALRYYIRHAEEMYNNLIQLNREKEAAELLSQMIKTIEAVEFRNLTFLRCGNASSLQYGIKIVQRILVKIDLNGSNMERIFRYTKMLHEEGDRMYKELLNRLVNDSQSGDLNQTSQIARMGQSIDDKLLLALRSIWESPRDTIIPVELTKEVKEWLNEISDPTFNKLWEVSLERK